MRISSTAGAFLSFLALVTGSSPNNARAEETKLLPQVAHAYGEYETPRSLAMGGALRALGNGTTAIFINPANMPLTRLYHLEASGIIRPESTRAVGTATAVDSITSSTKVTGGAAFSVGLEDPKGLDRTFTDFRSAVAYPIADKVFIGLGFRYLRMIQDGFGPFDNAVTKKYSPASGGLLNGAGQREAFVDTWTLDAGLTVRIGQSLHIGIVGQNVTHPGHSLLPTTVGGGIGYGNKDFSIEVDGLADFDSWSTVTGRFMGGGEYLVANKVPIRIGYQYDQGANVHSISGGIGYVSTEVGVEVGLRRTLSTTVNSTMIGLSLTYHLESSSLLSSRVNNAL
jgi:hypothetical protein